MDPWTAGEAALNITVSTTTVAAQGHLTTLFKVPTATPLTEFFCISRQGGSPRGLARIYIPPDLTPAGVEDDNASWRETATRFAVLSTPQATIRETVCARPPSPEEASVLRLRSSASVLVITRVATDTSGRITEAALLVFPGEHIDAVFTTHHPTNERQTQK